MEERRSKQRVIDLEVYTDGSLKKMGASMTFGGWSFIVVRDSQKIYEKTGNQYDTTNQRMELEAACQALQYVSSIRQPYERVIIYSDSAYLINCYLQEWYLTWQKNGWHNSNKKPVSNQDLWIEIIPYFDSFWYNFSKVKGHADNFWNNRCDELAQLEAEFLRKNWRGTNGQ